MDPTIMLSVLLLLCSLVGALMLIILTRVLKQGDDTNGKVTDQSATLARMEGSIIAHEARITALHDWREDLQRRELDKANAELVEERRKTNRRAEDQLP